MSGIVLDEVDRHAVDVLDAGGATLPFETAFDQLSGAGADHVACRVERDRGQTLTLEHEVERGDQVGRRVDEGTVKVENQGRSVGHRTALSILVRSCKMAGRS